MASPDDRGIDRVDEFDMCEDEDGWLIVQHRKENIIRIQSIDMIGAIDYGSPAFKSYHTALVDGESCKAGIPTFDDLAYTLEGVEGSAWHLGYCSEPGRYEVFQNVEGPFESTNFAKVDAENISGLDFHVLDVHYEDHEEDPHEENLMKKTSMTKTSMTKTSSRTSSTTKTPVTKPSAMELPVQRSPRRRSKASPPQTLTQLKKKTSRHATIWARSSTASGRRKTGC
ncbi:hypothetical protein C8034_v003403 [Colletotrichum sidae]|uniref:Uncharacterized protein n=1 Tax=Colletotrichum sidae TaxID=1347389 RepID=A0A4R8TAD2_9PEZI|nr:hypothetical protein C8034_v003403 [Colletotrichum sidae]